MDYKVSKIRLLQIFNEQGFDESLKQRSGYNPNNILIDSCTNGTITSVSFPGYKASKTGNGITYNYRIDI
ncbi:MAG: hypothetical protein GXO47_03515 [Chlorobi bacterium]|nr:hypothetical protein [Chlorobiota bacterium]